jgi:2'-5' RNA ligase
LIVTLSLEASAQERFEGLRRRWFPADRNFVPAHATLFHALPGDAALEAEAALRAEGSAAFMVDVTGLKKLGRGVAFTLSSPALSARRAAIARRFEGRLGRQDSAPFRPHITVQNKVSPQDAASLHTRLSAGFVPERVQAAGLHLWRYEDGPWAAVASVALDT